MKKNSRSTAREYQDRHQQSVCATPGCTRLTHTNKFARWCIPCTETRKRHGSTWHPGFTQADLRAKREQAAKFLADNPERHAKAVAWVHSKLSSAGSVIPYYRQKGTPAAELVRSWWACLRDRKRHHNKKPRHPEPEIVLRVVCVWMVLRDSQGGPVACPRDDYFVHTTYARAVKGMAFLPTKVVPKRTALALGIPESQRVTTNLVGHARRLLGKQLRELTWVLGLPPEVRLEG